MAQENAGRIAHAARVAYEAYGKATDYKNYQGLPMPEWDDLTDTIRGAWRAAALAVVDAEDEPEPPEFAGGHLPRDCGLRVRQCWLKGKHMSHDWVEQGDAYGPEIHCPGKKM
jgi:hypothetical protein